VGKPSAPEPPDYAAAAKAQGEANINSALGTTYLNQQNQVTPQGTLTYDYDQANGHTLPDGTVIPNTTVTTKLSPEQQHLYDQNVGLSTGLNDLAATGLRYVGQAVDGPLRAEQFGPQVKGPGVQSVALPSRTQPNLQSSFAAGGPVQTSFGATPNAQLQQSGQLGSINLNTPSYQTGLADAGAINGNVSANARTSGIAGAGNIQQSYGYGNLADAPKVEDFAAERDRTTDLLMQRLQPYIDRQQSALDTKLANRGINLGGRGYDTAQRLNATNVNDQRIAALLAGSQEQQRNFNNAMGIRQQGVGEATAEGNFYNAGQAQQFGQNQARSAFDLQASNDDFSQRLNSANFGNNAQGQAFSQGLAGAQFGNAARQQGFADQMGLAGANSQIASQNIANTLAGNNQALSAQQQEFAQAQARGQFANTAQQQQFAQNAGQAAFGNETALQGQSAELANVNAYNQARQQQFSQGLADASFNQDARGRAIQEANYFQTQPINILNALRSGNQVSMPQFGNYNAGANIAAAPVFDATKAQGDADMAAYNAKLQGYSGFMSGLGSIGGAALMASDRRLKRNIVELGMKTNGLMEYLFDYIWPAARQQGYMADEVEKLYPAAVEYHNGYAFVDYSKVPA
jgi:hypothetical protein